MSENLIIFNARIVTPTGISARKGAEMRQLRIIENGTVEVTKGIITYVGESRGEDRDGYYQHYWHYNARGHCLLPGFVDSHTHFVFGGERSEEFSWRLKGESYMSIMERGGGIASTVKATRQMNFLKLRSAAEGFLKKMSAMGVTTVEGKSGYGLDRETELLQLKIMRSLNNDEHKRIDIVSTFLGAHALPEEYKGRGDEYIDFLIREMLPVIRENELAECCDVFCEQGVFSIEQSRRLLQAAKEHGFILKLHADEIVSLGGAELAAELGALSADHLLHASDAGIRAMADAGVVATLLPLTAESRQLFLRFHPADHCFGLHLYANEHRRNHHRPDPERSRRPSTSRPYWKYRSWQTRRFHHSQFRQLSYSTLLYRHELCNHDY